MEHQSHVVPPPSPPATGAKIDNHTGHKAGAMSPGKVEMAQEMGHGAGADMDGMAWDMRNRLVVTLVLTVLIYLYAPTFVKMTGLTLPVPFGVSNAVWMFLLAIPAVFYGGWVFYNGANGPPVHKCALLTGLFCVLASGHASAQEPAPLSLDSLILQVATRGPGVAAEALRAEAMRLAIRRAGALDDPQITFMAEDVPKTLRGGMPMLRLQASQMLPWPGKRERMTRVAERESQVAGAKGKVVLLDAVTQAKRIYYSLYLSMEARRVNREQRAIADTLVDVVTGRLASGMAMHHDVLKMQTEASMLDDDLAMLEAERREMVAMLNALRDLPAVAPVGEPLEAWSPDAPLDAEALVSRAIAQRPEVQEMVAMAASRRAMAEVARREYYPDFMLGAFYDVRKGGEDMIGAMVNVSVPVWINRKQRIDVAVADVRANAADRDRSAMEAMVRAEVEQALARLSRVKRRSEILETELLDRAQQTFDAALAAFPAGKTNVLEILDALRVVSQRRLSRTTLRVERELALVDLARAVGEKGEVSQ